jgi:hypothetical protein
MEEVNRSSVLLEPPRFQPAGDSAVLVSFGDQIDSGLNRQVHTWPTVWKLLNCPVWAN